MHYFIALISGLIFGLGLLISGLANPSKVLAFLDLAGAWDPSLALVMAAAIAVAIIPFSVARRRPCAFVTGQPMSLPKQRQIDRPLVLGSLIFGAGWGIAGFCPGPAVVLAASGAPLALVFLVAMLIGMGVAGRMRT
ncbi:DUF6691 family protein [Alcaligenes ammonioxydans]|uniref:YeeE/YedE family protein n=1 Tax=Alcaligenes ammonioxydans TaxID=2582914 RepID=A0ABX8SRA4_9BURK|nr:DUF6691 family protein [Alcaligenes ammonioxydans]QBH20490.1 hypothetical protein EYC51_13855 [Alcaligenes faecalis]QXX78562.1 hypothetical protein FE795_05740 [Alcaligenes ammonioxydans]